MRRGEVLGTRKNLTNKRDIIIIIEYNNVLIILWYVDRSPHSNFNGLLVAAVELAPPPT
jgi:hypothetical protein